MIRLDAGISTARFCRLLDLSERTYRRWQPRERQGRPAKGPWPSPSADRIEPTAIQYADRYPQWGSRTIATLMRIDGFDAPDSTTYRALKRTGRVLEVNYQAERRQHAQARRAAFVVPPSAPTRSGSSTSPSSRRRWATPGGSPASPTTGASSSSAGASARPRTTTTRSPPSRSRSTRPGGCSDGSLLETITDEQTGELRPVAIVTDNGPCFKAHAFARFIDRHPELIHIRTRVKSPGQNGVRERASKSLKYEHLYRHEIDDGHQLGLQTDRYRTLFNTVRPHQTLDGRRPLDVHLEARQTRQTPKLSEPETLPPS